MRETGVHEAPLALAKTQIVKASNRELNTIFNNEVITAGDLYNLNSGLPIAGGLVTNLKRAWRGKSMLPFLIGLQQTMGKMKKVKQLYLNYPESPEELKIWRSQIVKLFDDHKRAETYYAETGKRPSKTASKATAS